MNKRTNAHLVAWLRDGNEPSPDDDGDLRSVKP